MIQRYLFSALKQGIDAITEDPSLLEPIFENYELAEGEIDSIKTLWTAKPPTVRHNFARPDDTFPLFALVLTDEREVDTVLADDAGMVEEEDDPLYGADVKTSFWAHNYQVLVYTDHPDATLYWYEVAKTIFLEAQLHNFGIYDFMLSGADVMPDPDYIPSHLFVRRLTLKANREFRRVLASTRLGKAFKVRGIHVDKSGSLGDPGPVKTLVVPFTEGDDG